MQYPKHISLLCLLLTALSGTAQTSQIAIPRVELMPNEPAPYNLRDWRQVALRYDSFVYDLTKTGQYLPLASVQPGGYNYPQYPAYRLHTYVGTGSPQNGEAINMLPSLVGATLAGADKSNQYGRNWVRMSQDFFNKNNGENIYLNNPNTGSGNDWWYDLMPNVFFYQLYDLYPNVGGDAGYQFTTVADRFLGAVRGLGGGDAPWQKAYMNYRAWNFKTQQANTTSVPEPEAAGAYAWVLYNAYQKTGDPAYLKGAEWSLEFLNEWTANPSYELQLPYGTYTAARMNAELGTKYDVEKMVNWSFNRGFLRGWGTDVGKWGGYDISGVVGEANDNGNDYAFQLNGVQQAAMLVPMVRYDKRFARAIGKWVLNLANATRLFYPTFLPGNLQEPVSLAWSTAHDPEHVIGYEAMREKSQGLSPYSTGDALNGGWAGTNLSL
ncbi:MAG: laminin G, partial [Saprospiraceae bacterium]